MSRKPKRHEPINASFDDVLKVIGISKYKDKKTIEKKRKKKGKK